MPVDQMTICIYDDFSFSKPVMLGTLYVNVIRGSEIFSFEYDKDWLIKTGCSLNLDPELRLVTGRQYASNKHIFGLFADASPDRWGRQLINKRERIHAEKEARKPRKLHDSDYLLGVYDETRMGGLRFKTDPAGPFLSDDKDASAPPWATLRAQNRPVILPFSSTSIFSAAGTRGRPGMVMMSPVRTTMKPSP